MAKMSDGNEEEAVGPRKHEGFEGPGTCRLAASRRILAKLLELRTELWPPQKLGAVRTQALDTDGIQAIQPRCCWS